MKINTKIILILILLLLFIMAYSFNIYQIDKSKKDNESQRNYLSAPNTTYNMGEMNISYPPYKQFCEDIHMTYFEEWQLFEAKSGCMDSEGEIHYYSFVYKDDYWNVGNRSYRAEWTNKTNMFLY
jgi:uncharacterized membrane protein